jgi:hypothetical protein
LTAIPRFPVRCRQSISPILGPRQTVGRRKGSVPSVRAIVLTLWSVVRYRFLNRRRWLNAVTAMVEERSQGGGRVQDYGAGRQAGSSSSAASRCRKRPCSSPSAGLMSRSRCASRNWTQLIAPVCSPLTSFCWHSPKGPAGAASRGWASTFSRRRSSAGLGGRLTTSSEWVASQALSSMLPFMTCGFLNSSGWIVELTCPVGLPVVLFTNQDVRWVRAHPSRSPNGSRPRRPATALNVARCRCSS